MFYYLNGTVALLDANLAVIDCGGVGYACHTSNYTLARLQNGKPAKLFTYCNIKEDAFDIYGFSTREELDCFRRLIGVTGVGTKAALAILSAVSPDQLTLAVMTQDAKKTGFWRSIVAVAWAMLGVRKGSEYERDFAQLQPLQVIAVGLVAVFVLVLGLIALVRWVS